MVKFSTEERNILSHFVVGNSVFFKGEMFTVVQAGKPKCKDGEPKTDIYLLLKNKNAQQEIKISYKKSDADFLENKIRAERAESLFGSNWQGIIRTAILPLKEKFQSRDLIFKQPFRKTEQGSITLGWKFELMNKLSGELSGKLPLSIEQCFDVYAGTNLPEEKRNATVNGEIIKDSGIANYMLVGESFSSSEEILEKICPIEEYVEQYNSIYFACKALNYRSFAKKWDGDRSLSVQVSWTVENGKLKPTLVFDRTLLWNGNAVAEQLKSCLLQLDIENTDDINEKNAEQFCIYQ